jgi:O-antigen ligase
LKLEELLASFLNIGTWSACATIGVGYALTLFGSHGPALRIVRAGIALFILLPIFRVVLMGVAFLRERDFRFAFIAGVVFAIIVLGIVLGVPAT